ncbi:hypothetical protein [Lactiplantibacillus plantarum]|nr:hypothetical protein [Lactiplantibacillus plantarum]
MTIEQHHIYGISGPNGSGKTILLKSHTWICQTQYWKHHSSRP